MITPSRRTLLVGVVGGVLAGCGVLPGTPGTAGWRTRVMSFNVLTPNRGAADFDPSVPPGEVTLASRAPVIAAWIRGADPDVVGLQENEAFSARMLPVRWLSPRLPGYTVLQPDVDVPVLVRDATYAVADSGVVDISQGHYSRHLVWARLTHLATGRGLLVANTHLDPYQRPDMARARTAEVEAIIAVLRTLSPSWHTPTLLTGDLNLRPDDPRPEYAAALATLPGAGLRDTATLAAKDSSEVRGAASVNGLGTTIDGTWRYRAIRTDGFRYDYVFASPRVEVLSWQVATGPGVEWIGGHPYFAPGPVASDHCPVLAEVSIPPA